MSQYAGVRAVVGWYLKAYGGWRAVAGSPYFHVSIVLTLVSYPLWEQPNWWDAVQAVLPNLLGFTLGGLAIFVSFGDERFKQLLAPKDADNASPFLRTSASFMHFIVVQVLALMSAVMAQGTYFHRSQWPVICKIPEGVWPSGGMEETRTVLWGVGYLLFIYALMLALAAAFQVFRMNVYFEKFQLAQAGDQSIPPTANDARPGLPPASTPASAAGASPIVIS